MTRIQPGSIPASEATGATEEALEFAAELVLEAAAAMVCSDGTPYLTHEDDAAMLGGSQDDAFAWVDDCEARLGCSGVAEFRAAVVDYFLLRDGGDARAVQEIAGRLAREAEDRIDVRGHNLAEVRQNLLMVSRTAWRR